MSEADPPLHVRRTSKVRRTWRQIWLMRQQNRTMHPRKTSHRTLLTDHRRLKRRKGIYYRRRLRMLVGAYHAGHIPLAVVNASVRGWVNHVRYGNTVGLRKKLFRSLSLHPPRELHR